jgi:alpha-beta hydrolase superfamily lysophospholipase
MADKLEKDQKRRVGKYVIAITAIACFVLSPICFSGETDSHNVTTPTLLLTGEADYRTPISAAEHVHQALKIHRVEAAMVHIPGASYDIAARPSNLIAKVANIIAWFEKYRTSVQGDQV